MDVPDFLKSQPVALQDRTRRLIFVYLYGQSMSHVVAGFLQAGSKARRRINKET